MRYIYQGFSKDGNGRVISSATVSVYLAGTSTVASIYAASSGGVAVNSVYSGSDGYFSFYVDDSDYGDGQLFKVVVSKSGFSSKEFDDIVIFPVDRLSLGVYSGNLETAVASIGSTETTLVIDVSVDDLTGALVIPDTLHLDWKRFTIGGSYALTINGQLTAGPYQIFDGVTVGGLSYSLPEWWGGKADNSTDNSVPIQSAIDSLSGGVVKFSQVGTYLVSSAVPQIKDDVTIEGIGEGAVWKIADSSNIDLIVSGNYPSSGGSDNIRLLNMTFDGNEANNTNNGSGVLHTVENPVILGCKFLGGDGTSILLKRCTDSDISHNTFDGAGADCIGVYDGCHRTRIVGNSVRNSKSVGIMIQGIENDQAESQQETYGVTISNNICEGNGTDGIRLISGVHDFVVTDNVSQDNGNNGIYLYGETNASNQTPTTNDNGIVSNNICKNNASTGGIHLSDDNDNTYGDYCKNEHILVFDNQCFDDQGVATQDYGINVQNNADYIYIKDNNCRDNASTDILIGGGVNSNGKLTHNVGYVTENSGEATSVATGGTFAHGLATTPTVVNVTPSSAGVTDLTVSADTVNVTVTFGGGGSQDFYWEAKIR